MIWILFVGLCLRGCDWIVVMFCVWGFEFVTFRFTFWLLGCFLDKFAFDGG